MDDKNTFWQCDTAKNEHGSDYHIREPSCVCMKSSFQEFQRNLQLWTSKNVLLQVSKASQL